MPSRPLWRRPRRFIHGGRPEIGNRLRWSSSLSRYGEVAGTIVLRRRLMLIGSDGTDWGQWHRIPMPRRPLSLPVDSRAPSRRRGVIALLAGFGTWRRVAARGALVDRPGRSRGPGCLGGSADRVRFGPGAIGVGASAGGAWAGDGVLHVGALGLSGCSCRRRMWAAQALGVAAAEPPRAMAFVLAPELLATRRIIAGCCPVAHSGNLGRSEHRQLPHTKIISQKIAARQALEPAKTKHVHAGRLMWARRSA